MRRKHTFGDSRALVTQSRVLKATFPLEKENFDKVQLPLIAAYNKTRENFTRILHRL
jgi:hypothetical protein